MRSLIIIAGLFLLASGQVALSADVADKPIVVAAAKLHAREVHAAPVHVTVSRVTRETSLPEGSLEKFSSAGLPQ